MGSRSGRWAGLGEVEGWEIGQSEGRPGDDQRDNQRTDQRLGAKPLKTLSFACDMPNRAFRGLQSASGSASFGSSQLKLASLHMKR